MNIKKITALSIGLVLSMCCTLSNANYKNNAIAAADTQLSEQDTEKTFEVNLEYNNSGNENNTASLAYDKDKKVYLLKLKSDEKYHVSEILINDTAMPSDKVYDADDKGLLEFSVSEDTNIKVKFSENKDCVVTFYDYNGNVYATQTVGYEKNIDFSKIDTDKMYQRVNSYTEMKFLSWESIPELIRDDTEVHALYIKASIALESLPVKTIYKYKFELIDLMGLSVTITTESQKLNEENEIIIEKEKIDVSDICISNYSTAKEAFAESDKATIYIYPPKNTNYIASYEITLQTPFIKGDIDENGTVDSIDASAVLTYYSQVQTGSIKEELTDVQISKADINNDNVIDAIDAAGILTYYAMISSGSSGDWDLINGKK